MTFKIYFLTAPFLSRDTGGKHANTAFGVALPVALCEPYYSEPKT